MLPVICEKCGNEYEVDVSLAGCVIKCPRCHSYLRCVDSYPASASVRKTIIEPYLVLNDTPPYKGKAHTKWGVLIALIMATAIWVLVINGSCIEKHEPPKPNPQGGFGSEVPKTKKAPSPALPSG
jgi:hypothetical protein